MSSTVIVSTSDSGSDLKNNKNKNKKSFKNKQKLENNCIYVMFKTLSFFSYFLPLQATSINTSNSIVVYYITSNGLPADCV